MELILISLAVLFFIIIIVKIFTLPINIAKSKNLSDNEITMITVLTWCGLFTGITWLIALCLAVCYKE